MGRLDGQTVAVVGSASHPLRPALESALTDEGTTLATLDGAPIDLVVHLPEPYAPRISLLDTDEAAWDAAAEAPPRDFLSTLQVAHPGLANAHGRLVVVLPHATTVGAAGLVAATTGWGAVRLLAVSASRRWAAEDIAVTVLTHRPDREGADLADAIVTLAASGALFNGATVEA